MNSYQKELVRRILISILLLGILFALTFLSGCEPSPKSTDQIQKEQTDKIMKELDNQVGMPDIVNFYEKKLMKQIYELRDRSDLVTYVYTVNQMTGKYVYQGKGIGFGLPYSTQFSNPMKAVDLEKELDRHISGYKAFSTMPQAEPNGLFTASGMSATWIIMINEETGELEIEYWEPSIVVTQSKKPRRLVEEWSLTEDY